MSPSVLPTTDPVNVYGPLVSRGDVTLAVLGQLQDPLTGLAYYVAERERRAGLPARSIPLPPQNGYRGGLDHETWESDDFPLVIVVAQRDGTPERHEGGRYAQWFEVAVSTIVIRETEADAIELADHYGIALTACLAENPSMGGLATETRLLSFPTTEFPDPDRRTTVRTIASLHVLVDPVLEDRYGPRPHTAPGQDQGPYTDPGQYPTVHTVDLTFESDDLSGNAVSTETVILDQG